MSKQDKTITFEVERQLAVLQECESGWQRELNRVVWNGEPVKFDIRAWSENHRKMSRGITLTDEEGWNLYNALKLYFKDAEERQGYWFDNGSVSCRCSECGCKNNRETDYCPNCGAKMEKDRPACSNCVYYDRETHFCTNAEIKEVHWECCGDWVRKEE